MKSQEAIRTRPFYFHGDLTPDGVQFYDAIKDEFLETPQDLRDVPIAARDLLRLREQLRASRVGYPAAPYYRPIEVVNIFAGAPGFDLPLRTLRRHATAEAEERSRQRSLEDAA